jgi:hypothetical protein
MQKVCLVCNTEYQSRSDNQLYCSKRCKHTAIRRRHGAKPQLARNWERGKRFGRLVITDRTPNKNGRQLWFCDCDCGTKGFQARADKLSSNRQQSCGCLRREQAAEAHKLKTEDERAEALVREASLLKELTEKKEALKAVKEKERVWTPALRSRRSFVSGTVYKKHDILKGIMFYAGTPKTDPLWSLRYYTEIIEDDECYYCKGSLKPESHSLDCKQDSFYEQMFQAHNVVPACESCITKRAVPPHPLSFEEMEMLAPVLELIRLQRESRQHEAVSNN